MVFALLKGIGSYDKQYGYIFSPKDIRDYFELLRKEQNQFAECYQDMLIEAVCEEGKSYMTKESFSKLATEHKVYLSEQEVETIMVIVAKQTSGQKVSRLTPEMLKEAITTARASSGKQLGSVSGLGQQNK